MAISWGAYSGGIRVGIEMLTSDSTPTYGQSVTITANYWIEANQNFSDNETFTWTFNGGSGTIPNVALPSYASKKVLTKTATVVANGSNRTINASGAQHVYSGQNPSQSNSITVPAVSGIPTNNGGYAQVSGTVTYTSIKYAWNAATANGSPVTGYQLQIADDSGFTTNVHTYTTTALSYTFTGLASGHHYYTRMRPTSAVGNGNWTTGGQNFITTAATAPSKPTSPTAVDQTYYVGTTVHPAVGGAAIAGNTNGSTGVTYQIAVATHGASISGITTGNGLTTGLSSPSNASPLTVAWNGTTGVTIAANTTYDVYFQAVGSAGSSGWTAVTTATTQVSGAQGTLLDRIRAAFRQIGSDTANPCCVVYATSVQTATTTAAAVSWGAANINTGTTPMWSSGATVTIRQSGTYLVSGKVSYASQAWAAGNYAEAEIAINGSGVEYTSILLTSADTASVPVPVAAKAVQCLAGDTVQMLLVTSRSGGATINTGYLYTSMTVVRIGP